jgi:hypothetical protein
VVQPSEASDSIVSTDNKILELLTSPLGDEWTVEGLVDTLLDAIAADQSENVHSVALDGTMDRQASRLLRPVLACLANKWAADSVSEVNLYVGRFSFKRMGPDGPVWIEGHFENRPGKVFLELRRSSIPLATVETSSICPDPLGLKPITT